MHVYKIFRGPEWAALQRDGRTAGAPADLDDGYIHLSTAAQVAETAAAHFAGVEGLQIVALEASALGPELKWEPARGGALFPHLYRPLSMADVQWHRPLPLGSEGRHVFPSEVR